MCKTSVSEEFQEELGRYADNDYDDVLKECALMLLEFPDDQYLMFQLAAAFLGNDEPESALKWVDKAEATGDGFCTCVAYTRGKALLSLGRHEEAMAPFTMIINLPVEELMKACNGSNEWALGMIADSVHCLAKCLAATERGSVAVPLFRAHRDYLELCGTEVREQCDFTARSSRDALVGFDESADLALSRMLSVARTGMP